MVGNRAGGGRGVAGSVPPVATRGHRPPGGHRRLVGLHAATGEAAPAIGLIPPSLSAPPGRRWASSWLASSPLGRRRPKTAGGSSRPVKDQQEGQESRRIRSSE